MNQNNWLYFSKIAPDDLTGFLRKWKKGNPDGGYFAMSAEASNSQIHILQKAFLDADVPLVGAVFPRLIVSSEFKSKGVLLLALPSMPEYVLSDSLQVDHSFDRMVDALNELLAGGRQGLLMMIFDGNLPDIASRVDECYLRFGDQVTYAGVNAGSESFQDFKCLFDQENVRENGMLALLLPPCRAPLIKHGFTLTQQLLPATTTKRNSVESINWRPAFEVYQELARDSYQATVTRNNLYQLGVKYPLGVVRAHGDVLVRIPVGLSENSSLHCKGEVPEFSLLTLLESNEKELLAAAEMLADDIEESGKKFGLTFYCAGRAMFLGEKAVRKELEFLKQSMDTICGAVSLGEIGSNRGDGYPALQNMSILFCPCGNND